MRMHCSINVCSRIANCWVAIRALKKQISSMTPRIGTVFNATHWFLSQVSQSGGGGEGRRRFNLTDVYLIRFILICNGRCSLISNLEMLF